MAGNKKSFILYCDIIHTVSHLTDDQAGVLFKHILLYVNDRNPENKDILINLAFEPIKQQLKRDLKKWDTYIKKQRDNGKRGGRPPLEKETQKTQPFIEKPKKADNVNANVNVNDTVNVMVEEAATRFSKEVIYNAEETITKNQIEFQRICAGAGFSFDIGAEALHKYHLHLEEKEQYPKGRKSVFAGFEKWMANEKNFINNRNGTHQQPNRQSGKNGKSTGAHNLVNQMRDEFNRSGQ